MVLWMGGWEVILLKLRLWLAYFIPFFIEEDWYEMLPLKLLLIDCWKVCFYQRVSLELFPSSCRCSGRGLHDLNMRPRIVVLWGWEWQAIPTVGLGGPGAYLLDQVFENVIRRMGTAQFAVNSSHVQYMYITTS